MATIFDASIELGSLTLVNCSEFLLGASLGVITHIVIMESPISNVLFQSRVDGGAQDLE